MSSLSKLKEDSEIVAHQIIAKLLPIMEII